MYFVRVCLCRWIAFTDLLQKAKPVKLYKAVDPVFQSKPVLGEIHEDRRRKKAATEGSQKLPVVPVAATRLTYHMVEA